MTRLTNLTPAEKQFLDDAVAAAERASRQETQPAEPTYRAQPGKSAD